MVVASTKHRSGLLFSPHKHRASKSRKSVLALAQAVLKVMKAELGEKACMRWPGLIDEELGETLFLGIGAKKQSKSIPTPRKPSDEETGRAWTPIKPNLTRLLLKAFASGNELLSDEKPLVLEAPISMRTDQHCKCIQLSKLLARRAIEWIKCNHRGALEASGEISAEQLQCNVRLDRTLARVASDVLAYLSVVALEGDQDDEVVLELHNTDQRLIGISTRGCGIVFCEQGRTRFESAATRVLIQLEGAPMGPTEAPEAPSPCGVH